MDKKRAESLARIGCIVCRNYGRWNVPAEIHHLLGIKYRATGKKACDSATIPLCANHHRNGGHGTAIHAGVKTWEAMYGTQEEMLEQVNAIIEEHNNAH